MQIWTDSWKTLTGLLSFSSDCLCKYPLVVRIAAVSLELLQICCFCWIFLATSADLYSSACVLQCWKYRKYTGTHKEFCTKTVFFSAQWPSCFLFYFFRWSGKKKTFFKQCRYIHACRQSCLQILVSTSTRIILVINLNQQLSLF